MTHLEFVRVYIYNSIELGPLRRLLGMNSKIVKWSNLNYKLNRRSPCHFNSRCTQEHKWQRFSVCVRVVNNMAQKYILSSSTAKSTNYLTRPTPKSVRNDSIDREIKVLLHVAVCACVCERAVLWCDCMVFAMSTIAIAAACLILFVLYFIPIIFNYTSFLLSISRSFAFFFPRPLQYTAEVT